MSKGKLDIQYFKTVYKLYEEDDEQQGNYTFVC